MLLKLKIAVPKQYAPVNQFWSTIVTYVRARDRRILARMNVHNLRDIGLDRAR